MSRGIIFGTGFVALVLMAFFCIPRHLPETASGASHPNFTATISNGQLTLSGDVGSARAKQAVVARAQELAKSTKLRVGEELTVLPNGDGKLDAVLPSLLASLTSLHSQQASLSLSDQTVTVQGTAASDEVKTKLLHEVSSLVGSSMRVQDRIAVTQTATVSLPPSPPAATAHPSRAQVQSGLDELLRGEHIAFESNSAVLTSKGRAVIDKLIPALKRMPEAAIEIGGHTDSYGDPEYNLQLSQARAEAVRQYMADHGVGNRLTAVGYGSSRPLSPERTRAASKKNRRIEFRVKEER